MDIRPLSRWFGAEVHGADLTRLTTSDIKSLLAKYRLVIFKNKHPISGESQVELSRKLGVLHSTFYKHPRSPHPDVFRVSNDEDQGCTQVGRSGWHIDGTFELKPFAYQTMHFHSVIPGGDTLFMPLKEFFDAQPEERQSRWEKLWMVTKYGVAHPLCCEHDGRRTMLFHCGHSFVSHWLLATGEPSESSTIFPGAMVQQELTECLNTAFEQGLGYRAAWEENDFAICDNRSLAHYAVQGTQQDPDKVGLRILHRTTIAGESIPTNAQGLSSRR